MRLAFEACVCGRLSPSLSLPAHARRCRLPGWLSGVRLDQEQQYQLRLLAALRQWHVLAHVDQAAPWAELTAVLHCLESFYDVLGGAVGYQLTALRLVHEAEAAHSAHSAPPPQHAAASFHRPVGLDLAEQPGEGLLAAAAGLRSLAGLGELYPLGGAGDRLGLRDEVSGEALPVALLPYAGRSLLESLLRDLAAREFLHFRLFGVQLRTPVAVMTSAAKGNHAAAAEVGGSVRQH